MEITVAQEHGRMPISVMHIKGSVDGGSYEQLQTRAMELIDEGTRNLVLDLEHVPYMSSAGLRAINAIFHQLRSDAPNESDQATSEGIRTGTFKSPHLKLLNPSPRVLQALQTAGYDMFLEIHRNPKDAIASF